MMTGLIFTESGQKRGTAGKLLFVAAALLAGGFTGWWQTRRSIHIHSGIASLESALAWTIIAVVVIAIHRARNRAA